MISLILMLACTDNKEDTTEATGNGCDGSSKEGAAICDAWMYNESSSLSSVLQEDSSGIVTDIASSTVVEEGGKDYLLVSTSGVPSYQKTLSQTDIDSLNARPNAATDFANGVTTAQANMTYDFGEDIGYNSNTDCATGAGYGWWPPGPVCPTNQYKELYFPFTPEPASGSEVCETGLGALGLFVNGVSVYNWSDGASYNSEGVWMNVAAKYEVYDLGPCGGHAANGDYHHHDLSECLSDQLNDDGSAHSEVFGAAFDGYLIYGPYVDSNTVAQSCWVARDYTDADDATGCGGTGERSCQMVDVTDPSLGTEVVTQGPTTSAVVTSMSGNNFVATSGFYKEDYYYDSDCTDQGIEYLDQYNGHDHDDLGYHYHITYSYPYFTGPTLYGTVDTTLVAMSCDGVEAMGGPGGPRGK